jgi:hypothetical protein
MFMQISFADLSLLLTEADKNNCLILFDEVVIDFFDSWIKGLQVFLNDETTHYFTDNETVVNIFNDEIELKTNDVFTHSIKIYKKPVTTKEYLTTLDFLKNIW